MPNEIYHRSNWGNANAEGFGDVYFDAAATNKLYNHSDYYENSWGTDKILRDLPNKASIVLTPTAYSGGILNTVIPPYQVLPTELVTNGTFDTDLSGWQIVNSDATHTVTRTSDGARFQSDTTTPIMFFETIDFILQSGKKYSLRVEIVNVNSGAVKIEGNNINLFYTDNGVFTDVIEPTGNGRISFYRHTSNVDLTIKSVSVKEIQEADFDFSRGSSATRVNEQGLIESIASGLPRIDYTSGFGSLLLEPQRSNLVTYSEQFDINSSWLSSGRPVVDTNVVVSPDGSQNGSKLTFNSGDALRAFSEFTFTNGYSYSIFVKKDVGRYVTIFAAFFTTSVTVGFDLDEGTCQSGGVIEDYGNGWYRISVSKNVAGDADKSGYFYLYSTDTLGSAAAADGNKLYVYGAQVEEGSYPTSYIPTSGSTVTRSADVANNSSNTDLINSTEGVLYAEISALANDGTNRLISLSDGTADERLFLQYSSTDNRLQFLVKNGGSTQCNIIYDASDLTAVHKVAAKYKANDFALWVDGVEIGTDTSGNVASGLSKLQFDRGYSGLPFYGNVKELAVFKEALTDAELESLTSWVSFTEMATDLEYTLE